MKKRETKIIAKILTDVTKCTLRIAANTRCALIYHQPEQPEDIKKFRKYK